jgi:hypothetical protein
MILGRDRHTTTLMSDSRVLAVGGVFQPSQTAEVYDPEAGTWGGQSELGQSRFQHTATLLEDGAVLVAGGSSPVCEIFDPVAGDWSATGSMSTARQYHTATLLLDGRVLVAGGDYGGSALSSAEIYKPLNLGGRGDELGPGHR